MGISAKELAALSGVSPATVSMVLNGRPGIGEATRKKVLETATQYGYDLSRHVISAAQQTHREYTINLVFFKKSGQIVADTPFFTELMEGIVEACGSMQCPFRLSYHYCYDDFETQAKAKGYREASGLILLGTEMGIEDIQQFLALGVPCVILDCYYDEILADFVLINNTQGAYLATRRLIDAGHRRIGYLRSGVRIANFEERSNGYYQALRRSGLETSHPYVIDVSPIGNQCYEDMLHYLASDPPLATAYFADNDIIAAAAIRAFAEKGVAVPEQVSIIGFDDMPFCQLMTPALTTMRVARRSLATIAVNRLLEKLQYPQSNCRKISIATTMIERNSVCELPKSIECI